MAKLVKIESASQMAFTPKDGYITNTIGEVEGQITELVKKSDGTIVTMGGGGDTEFYKCASVDTTAKTWSGYKAVLTDGVYTFEETVTTGLTYGNGFTPQVGTIYNADATVRVAKMFEGASALPEDGMMFWLPFNGNAEPAVGTVTSMTGELTYGEANGIGYAVFDGSQVVNLDFPIATMEGDLTLALMYCVDSYPGATQTLFNNYSGNQGMPRVSINNSGIIKGYWGGDGNGNLSTIVPAAGTWNSVIITMDRTNGVMSGYLNGTLGNTSSNFGSINQYNTPWFIGGNPIFGESNGWQNYVGKLADVSLWNRVLTAEEIAQVAARAASMN